MSLRARVMQSKIDDVYAILRKYRKYEELNDEQRKFFERLDKELLDALKDET